MTALDIERCSIVELLHELSDGIRAVKRCDLEVTDIDHLKQQLGFLFSDSNKWDRLHRNGGCYRAVRCNSRPSHRNELFYPPSNEVTTFGRCNRPGQAVLYGFNSLPATLYEIQAQPGDQVAIAYWAAQNQLMYYLGTEEVEEREFYRKPLYEKLSAERTFRALKKHDAYPSVIDNPWSVRWGIASQFAHEFMMCEFSRFVARGNEHEFKVTIALTEIIKEVTLSKLANTSDSGQFAGIVYPSLAFRSNSSNVVYFPELVAQFNVSGIIFLRV